MRLEEAKEQHKKLETTIARRIEVIGKLHADHADEKARLFKEMDELRVKVAQEKRQSEHEIKELRKLTTDLRSGHGRAIAAERERAADSLAESQERYDELAIELSDAQKVNDGFSATIQTLEKQKKELSVKLSDSKAAVLREKKTVVQVRQKCSLLETQLSAAQQKHKQTSHYLIVVLVFLWRFSRYLGGRLATSLRSRNTLLVQWKVLSQQKIQSRRALIRSLNMNQTLHTQLMTQGIARIEAERLANTWKQRLVESVERREKASSKFLACIQRTKGRFNETTRRLLTGVLFLWRLNLLLSQRLATTGRILRAIEDAPELADIVSLARIEEVSEPSGSKCSIASLAEAISENSLTSASSGLGLSLDSVPRLTSEASIQTTDETDIPSTLSVKGEHLIFQSCGVDTADLEPTAVDVGVMTEPSPEEALLGERIACLNKKFDSMETIDSIYLRLFVKPQQAVHPLPSASPASPTLNRIPFPGRIGVPIIPSAVRQPFIPQPSVLANRLVQKGNGRIFSEALDRVPFPQHAYMRQDAGPSTPGLVPQAGSPQIPGTPTPASMRGHRHPFLLNNTPGNLSFN
ncbi:hypothetical protein BDY19DRAFT_391189 [Irpex rosettiformis]|uniref:Uncharacterized protein n=1 Tax=Irpex rosettiformis TaxID=378272 RepID=A0ACB8TUU8_9APHY|nr:hypothetical protein BDY19DRAFT_391189 [Irpex rosettiformis]